MHILPCELISNHLLCGLYMTLTTLIMIKSVLLDLLMEMERRKTIHEKVVLKFNKTLPQKVDGVGSC